MPPMIKHSPPPANQLSKAQAYMSAIAGHPKAVFRRPYIGALGALRTLLSNTCGARSDDAVLTAALLSTFALATESSDYPVLSHLHGLRAIMLARVSDTGPNELTRALMNAFRPMIFARPVAQGLPSPFESWGFHELEPFNYDAQPDCVIVMQKIVVRLCSRLPRLIAATRCVAEDPHCSQAKDLAFRLAEQLLIFENTASENDFLRRLNVHKTRDLVDIIPTSLNFASPMAWYAGMSYWAYQILLFRVCYRLNSLFPERLVLRDIVAMRVDVLRMARNIAMASEIGEEIGAYSAMVVPVIAVWGALADFEDFLSPAALAIRTWALHWASKVFDPDLPLAQMTRKLNELADMYAGGPLQDPGDMVQEPSTDERSSASPIPRLQAHQGKNETEYSRGGRITFQVMNTV